MKFIKILIGLLLTVSCFSVFAETSYNCLENSLKKTAVLFANGMFNDNKSIKDSKNEMIGFVNQSLLNDDFSLSSSEVLVFDTLENKNEFILFQLWEVAKQRESISYDNFSNWLLGNIEKPNNFKGSLGEYFKEGFPNRGSLINNGDKDLSAMISKIENYVKSGYRIIIFAHSQGNIYANEAVKTVVENNSSITANNINIVSVASPDNYVYSGYEHSTAEEDAIINMVRFAFSDTLYPSFSLQEGSGFIDHSFIDVYLKKDVARAYVESSFLWAWNNTEYIEKDTSEIIKVEMSSTNENMKMVVRELISYKDNSGEQHFDINTLTPDNLVQLPDERVSAGTYTDNNNSQIYTLSCNYLGVPVQNENIRTWLDFYVYSDIEAAGEVTITVNNYLNNIGDEKETKFFEIQNYADKQRFHQIFVSQNPNGTTTATNL